MHFLPILSSLRRHRTAAVLIVVEIALTCAIVCNAIFLIKERMAKMDRPSGVVEEELVRVRITGIGKTADAAAVTARDIDAMRAIPGVKSVASSNMLPFGGSSWNSSVSTKPDDPDAPANLAMWVGTPDLIETMGVKIIAGRDFTPEEYVLFKDVRENKAKMGSLVVTKTVADFFW